MCLHEVFKCRDKTIELSKHQVLEQETDNSQVNVAGKGARPQTYQSLASL